MSAETQLLDQEQTCLHHFASFCTFLLDLALLALQMPQGKWPAGIHAGVSSWHMKVLLNAVGRGSKLGEPLKRSSEHLQDALIRLANGSACAGQSKISRPRHRFMHWMPHIRSIGNPKGPKAQFCRSPEAGITAQITLALTGCWGSCKLPKGRHVPRLEVRVVIANLPTLGNNCCFLPLKSCLFFFHLWFSFPPGGLHCWFGG